MGRHSLNRATTRDRVVLYRGEAAYETVDVAGDVTLWTLNDDGRTVETIQNYTAKISAAANITTNYAFNAGTALSSRQRERRQRAQREPQRLVLNARDPDRGANHRHRVSVQRRHGQRQSSRPGGLTQGHRQVGDARTPCGPLHRELLFTAASRGLPCGRFHAPQSLPALRRVEQRHDVGHIRALRP